MEIDSYDLSQKKRGQKSFSAHVKAMRFSLPTRELTIKGLTRGIGRGIWVQPYPVPFYIYFSGTKAEVRYGKIPYGSFPIALNLKNF